MNSNFPLSTPTGDLDDETTLRELYLWLRSHAKGLAAGMASLQGQERDAEEDFVQETVVRTFLYSQRTGIGSGENPFKSLKYFALTTMRNYREDRRRKDHRLVRIAQLQDTSRDYIAGCAQVDPSEIAVEEAFREELFLKLAPEIASFPPRQRQALLIDLANHMCFDEQPTSLQKAFLSVGIRLQDYQQLLPEDPLERRHFASNLIHAYKRLKKLVCVQQYLVA
jgi:DNA-directed RNA polymerase specialized sigma24 family protein